jgi:predicted ArsR family transcriptional regulator
MAASDEHARVHRALAEEHRARIVEELHAEVGGLPARELAARLGLHPNTIRWHLAILADAGLVAGKPAERTTPGRPPIVYVLAAPAGQTGSEGYRFLATVLGGALSRLDDGVEQAFAAGCEWGRHLVPRPPPGARVGDEEATREVLGLLAQHGFRPEAAADEIRMHACPFRELAETEPGIVCGLHRGLIAGALAGLGAGLTIASLDAFVEPGLCVARLARAAPNGRYASPPESSAA